MNGTSNDTEYLVREARADFERRMEAIERAGSRQGASRWLGVIFGTVALIAVTLVSTRTADAYRLGTVAPTLQAGAFVLKDSDGVERATMSIGDDGGAAFGLTDADGRVRLKLSVLSDGSPGVTLLDGDGESRAILGLLSDGTTTLVLADRGSIARGVFTLTPDGAARMIFSDSNGQTRTAVGVNASGQPEINTIDVEEGDGPLSEQDGQGR
jgi:hypothetical protein